MKKVTIIGSESFLAKNFLKYCYDNNLDKEIAFSLYDFVEKDDANKNYMKIDFFDLESIHQINFNVDYIFIFIGKTGTVNGFEQYKSFIEVNELLLLNILNVYNLKKSNAKIIYPSTRLIYQSNDFEKIKEDSPLELKSVYAISKYAAEQYLKLYGRVYNVDYVILRICTPIGTLLSSDGNYGTFEIFRNQARNNGEISIFGEGNQIKTFTHIEDICKAFIKLIQKETCDYNEYNLGGSDLKLIDIAKQIADEFSVLVRHVPWPTIYEEVDGGSVTFDSSRFDEEFEMTYQKIS